MRTLVDIPNDDVKLVNDIAGKLAISRAELVRRAIGAFLRPHREANEVAAFGLWAHRAVDGQEYQDRMRTEW